MTELAEKIAQDLQDQQGVELIPGRRLADDILSHCQVAAAEAFSRSGEMFDLRLLDTVTTEIADKAAGTLQRYHDAMRMGREHEVPFPHAAVTHLLAVVAALRAAVGYTPTKTARELFAERRETEKVTAAGDQTRLHLAAEHGVLFALGASDRLAADEHARRHATAHTEHSGGDLAWQLVNMEAHIAAAEREGMPRGQFDGPVREHLARGTANYLKGEPDEKAPGGPGGV